MLKNRVMALIIVIIILLGLIPIYAQEVQYTQIQNLRIGLVELYYNKEKIEVLNNELVLGYEDKEQFKVEMIFSGYDTYTFMSTDGYLLRSGICYESYDEARKVSNTMQTLGYSAFPGVIGVNEWYIYVGGYETIEIASNKMNEINSSMKEDTYKLLDDNGTFYTMMADNLPLLIVDGVNSYPQYMAIDNLGIMDLGSRQYRGRIEFGVFGNDSVGAINIVDIEEYLYGVLPSEVYYKWEMEALKAQAVAARTYAVYNTIVAPKYAKEPYNLDDTVYSQVYKGYGVEMDRTNKAVEDTAGQVILYDNKPIAAFFHSTSGGHTENSENVWSSSVPYLRGVSDTYELQPEAKPWIVVLTAEEIKAKLESIDQYIGDVLELEVTETFDSGRIKSLLFIGTEGSCVLEKNNIRKLGLKSTKFTLVKDSSYIPTVNVISSKGTTNQIGLQENQQYVVSGDGTIKELKFTEGQVVAVGQDNLQNYTNMQAAKDTYIFAGMGYGHGVGMSQSGAQNMALNGFDYEEILTHYYTGTSIEKILE